jgi:hypothetical protein
VLIRLLGRADEVIEYRRPFVAMRESLDGPERQCAAHGDTAAFWGRADMPALGGSGAVDPEPPSWRGGFATHPRAKSLKPANLKADRIDQLAASSSSPGVHCRLPSIPNRLSVLDVDCSVAASAALSATRFPSIAEMACSDSCGG